MEQHEVDHEDVAYTQSVNKRNQNYNCFVVHEIELLHWQVEQEIDRKSSEEPVLDVPKLPAVHPIEIKAPSGGVDQRRYQEERTQNTLIGLQVRVAGLKLDDHHR